MKILFKNHFQPMLECCELLEDCLRKERYEETLRGEHLPIEEEKRIQSHIDVLTDIRSVFAFRANVAPASFFPS